MITSYKPKSDAFFEIAKYLYSGDDEVAQGLIIQNGLGQNIHPIAIGAYAINLHNLKFETADRVGNKFQVTKPERHDAALWAYEKRMSSGCYQEATAIAEKGSLGNELFEAANKLAILKRLGIPRSQLDLLRGPK